MSEFYLSFQAVEVP